MKKIQSHLLGIDHGSIVLFSDFENGGQMWTGQGPRMMRQPVTFAEPFRAVPHVQVAMSMWDMDQDTNQRVDLSVDGVTELGFDLVFRTWGDSRVARVRADWTAFGELAQEDGWDLFE